MFQTRLSPEEKLANLEQERTKAKRRAQPVDSRAWSGMDWLIVCAILGCAVLLARVVSV